MKYKVLGLLLIALFFLNCKKTPTTPEWREYTWFDETIVVNQYLTQYSPDIICRDDSLYISIEVIQPKVPVHFILFVATDYEDDMPVWTNVLDVSNILEAEYSRCFHEPGFYKAIIYSPEEVTVHWKIIVKTQYCLLLGISANLRETFSFWYLGQMVSFL
jgi:hypothetical protein